jgi:hypothetical protein
MIFKIKKIGCWGVKLKKKKHKWLEQFSHTLENFVSVCLAL